MTTKYTLKDYYSEGLGNENQKFQTHYSENNKWRATTLTINEKSFKVKIKAHGRTPYAHKFGQHFSLSIKFIEKPFPYFSKRINLIIYNRIQLRSESVSLLANKFNLPTANYELVYAEIGNHKGSLYFVEERINKDFFLKRKLPWIIFNKGLNGSLIYHGDITPQELGRQMILELEKRSDLSNLLKSHVAQDYLSFNNGLFEKNVKNLKTHLDIDYCARLNAFRIINGDDGHGFNSNNFEMAYDTTQRFFYPIVHRDNNSTKLVDCKNPYPFMDKTRVNIPFFILLDSDTTFTKITNQIINSFLNLYGNSSVSIAQEIDSINKYYKQSHVFEFTGVSKGIDGKWIIDNIDCLCNLKN